jgi:beta-aspartyl-peptidase (threonine type)
VRGRVIVHGGVDCPASVQAELALGEACRAGWAALERGGPALLAVEEAIRVLEANPLFNAGVGSVLNELGDVETDAGIVDGTGGRFAGVAALGGALHPITVAAELLRRAPGPVLLAGSGARRFARQVGAAEGDLRTPEQLRNWEEARRGGGARSPFTGRAIRGTETVGAIVVDGEGRLAAGSSTGGVLLKMPGRVGDAAIFGAGIYADDRVAALCSGLGEAAIELALAVRAVDRYRTLRDLTEAATWAIGILSERRAIGGIVLFDAATDQVAVMHNAAAFPVFSEAGTGPERIKRVRGLTSRGGDNG